jgi:hypothetical protein
MDKKFEIYFLSHERLESEEKHAQLWIETRNKTCIVESFFFGFNTKVETHRCFVCF